MKKNIYIVKYVFMFKVLIGCTFMFILPCAIKFQFKVESRYVTYFLLVYIIYESWKFLIHQNYTKFY